jgi:hypothetical protein
MEGTIHHGHVNSGGAEVGAQFLNNETLGVLAPPLAEKI